MDPKPVAPAPVSSDGARVEEDTSFLPSWSEISGAVSDLADAATNYMEDNAGSLMIAAGAPIHAANGASWLYRYATDPLAREPWKGLAVRAENSGLRFRNDHRGFILELPLDPQNASVVRHYTIFDDPFTVGRVIDFFEALGPQNREVIRSTLQETPQYKINIDVDFDTIGLRFYSEEGTGLTVHFVNGEALGFRLTLPLKPSPTHTAISRMDSEIKNYLRNRPFKFSNNADGSWTLEFTPLRWSKVMTNKITGSLDAVTSGLREYIRIEKWLRGWNRSYRFSFEESRPPAFEVEILSNSEGQPYYRLRWDRLPFAEPTVDLSLQEMGTVLEDNRDPIDVIFEKNGKVRNTFDFRREKYRESIVERIPTSPSRLSLIGWGAVMGVLFAGAEIAMAHNEVPEEMRGEIMGDMGELGLLGGLATMPGMTLAGIPGAMIGYLPGQWSGEAFADTAPAQWVEEKTGVDFTTEEWGKWGGGATSGAAGGASLWAAQRPAVQVMAEKYIPAVAGQVVRKVAAFALVADAAGKALVWLGEKNEEVQASINVKSQRQTAGGADLPENIEEILVELGVDEGGSPYRREDQKPSHQIPYYVGAWKRKVEKGLNEEEKRDLSYRIEETIRHMPNDMSRAALSILVAEKLGDDYLTPEVQARELQTPEAQTFRESVSPHTQESQLLASL